ncbi:MAG: hypothetical protein RLY43_1419 [Bacteroidota bacterium]|jgi:hypothetical protein
MIFCTEKERNDKIFNLVQTILNIENEQDLEVYYIGFKENGVHINYKQFKEGEWVHWGMLITNSQLILLLSFEK